MRAGIPASPPLRRAAGLLIDGLMRATSRPMTDAELAAPAIVFAPHQDDETLGCGGTILRKRALDARVRIVYLTEGGASHGPPLIDRPALAAMREAEARNAAGVLGVADADLTFLGFPDGALGTRRDDAVEAVAELLSREAPMQVFAPFRHDGLPDHVETRTIVASALDRVGAAVDLFTYPVWFWSHWPWMRASVAMPAFARRRHGRRSVAGLLRAVTGLRVRVPIRAQLERKRRALDEHRSQMARREDEPAWHVLADVAGGDFLERLLGEDEYFHHERRHGVAGRRPTPRTLAEADAARGAA